MIILAITLLLLIIPTVIVGVNISVNAGINNDNLGLTYLLLTIVVGYAIGFSALGLLGLL